MEPRDPIEGVLTSLIFASNFFSHAAISGQRHPAAPHSGNGHQPLGADPGLHPARVPAEAAAAPAPAATTTSCAASETNPRRFRRIVTAADQTAVLGPPGDIQPRQERPGQDLRGSEEG